MAGRKGVLFDTSTWSPIDLLDFYRQIPPEQVCYASDYPYGQQPSSLLIALKTARLAGLRRHAAARDARRHREHARRRRGAARADLAARERQLHPAPAARAHPSVPLDGDARFSGRANPTPSASSASRSTRAPSETATPRPSTAIRDLLVGARDLWATLPEIEHDGDLRDATRLVFRLIHLADIESRDGPAGRGACLSCASTAISTSSTRRSARRSPRRCATSSHSPARKSRAARVTAARAPCSSTACRRSRASRSSTRSATAEVTTIEGLRDHPMVASFVRADALQCGFCTPGQIVSAVALVESNADPSHDEIRHAMAGNLCRCGAYPKIEEAIRSWRD